MWTQQKVRDQASYVDPAPEKVGSVDPMAPRPLHATDSCVEILNWTGLETEMNIGMNQDKLWNI